MKHEGAGMNLYCHNWMWAVKNIIDWLNISVKMVPSSSVQNKQKDSSNVLGKLFQTYFFEFY